MSKKDEFVALRTEVMLRKAFWLVLKSEIEVEYKALCRNEDSSNISEQIRKDTLFDILKQMDHLETIFAYLRKFTIEN